MKNVMVANLRKKSKNPASRLHTLMKAQIDNSLQHGWLQKDIILLTNFEFSHNGVVAIPIKLNDFCLTGSKVFGVKWLMENTDYEDPFWVHDLDAWQNAPFKCPEFKDAGFGFYSRPKINGGVQFWRRKGKDILDDIVNELIVNKAAREEPTLDKFCKNNKRVTILNSTFNVGCSGYKPRYEKAEKPVKICHFHPDNRIAWQTHCLDRNGLGFKGISDVLETVVRAHYPNLQETLDEEGAARQQEHLNNWAALRKKEETKKVKNTILETAKLLK